MAEIERLNRRVRARGDRSTNVRPEGHRSSRRHLLTRWLLLVVCSGVLEVRRRRNPSLGVVCGHRAGRWLGPCEQVSGLHRLARPRALSLMFSEAAGMLLVLGGVGIA